MAVPDIGARRTRWAFILSLILISGCTAANTAPTATDGYVPDAAPATPVTEQALRTPPEIKAPKPADLIGLGGSALLKTLGPATLKRQDLGNEIWQYKAESCVLFLFLYPSGDQTQVRHIDARGAAPEPCIRAVVRAARSGGTG